MPLLMMPTDEMIMTCAWAMRPLGLIGAALEATLPRRYGALGRLTLATMADELRGASRAPRAAPLGPGAAMSDADMARSDFAGFLACGRRHHSCSLIYLHER